jgi:WD40 repeat protein
MNRPLKPIIGFLGFLGAAIALYAWYYPLNKGQISVHSNIGGYEIRAGKRSITCPEDLCEFYLPTGYSQLTASKEGFVPVSFEIDLARGDRAEQKITLHRIPSLERAATPPELEPAKNELPAELRGKGILHFAWHQDGEQLAYLDPADGRLKIFREGQNPRRVTALRNIPDDLEFVWSPDGGRIAAFSEKAVYRISTEDNTRQKTETPGAVKALNWSPDNAHLVLTDPDNKVTLIHEPGGVIENPGISIDLKLSAWLGPDRLIFAENQRDSVRFASLDPSTGTVTQILEKSGIQAGEAVKQKNQIYFLDLRENIWYAIEE